MRQHRLSEYRVKRVLYAPRRVEEGIAPGTIAMMQRAGTKKHPYEVWVMLKKFSKGWKIISAWRYPGITAPGEPLPEAILREIQEGATYGATEK
ncbi:hypothetical protein D6779_11830 [Candidatus Parcubacteria bacterium]|nr:MAG: hypothetical protein D6779_11830 [Candidatus Parcubacteria bacterium]